MYHAVMARLACRRLSREEAAASKHALENVEPDWAIIQCIMEEFISNKAEISSVQGEVWPCSCHHRLTAACGAAGSLCLGSHNCDHKARFHKVRGLASPAPMLCRCRAGSIRLQQLAAKHDAAEHAGHAGYEPAQHAHAQREPAHPVPAQLDPPGPIQQRCCGAAAVSRS